MIVLLRQELYKLFHRSYFLYTVIGLIFFQLLHAFGAANVEGMKESFVEDYGIFVISLLVFLLSVNTWVTEYQTGAMKLIIARQYNRSMIYLSKIITVLFYHIILLAVSYVTVILGKMIFGIGGQTSWWESGTANLLATWPIVGVMTVLIILIKTAAIPMALGVSISLGGYIFNLLMGSSLIQRFDFTKYSPVNALQAGQQLLVPKYEIATHLNLATIISSNIIYTVLLLLLAGFAFNRQNN